MQRQHRVMRLSVLSLALAAICGAPAYAADSAADAVMQTKKAEVNDKGNKSDNVLDTVTVSANNSSDPHTKTELGKLTEHTPISGAVVDQEEIEHLQLVNNLLELGKRVPGISMIRNMRIPDGGKQYTENRIDGMRSVNVNTSLLDEVDMADIDRIEVITGPSSALYGSGALGGTISVFTRQPPKELGAKLSQEVGSWGFNRTQGNIGTSFANGRAGFTVSASTMDNDGWRKNTAPSAQDAAAEHKNGISLRTLLLPTDTTKVTLGLSQLHYDYRWAGPIAMNATEAAKLKNVTLNGTNLRSVHFDNDWQQVTPGTYGQYIDTYDTTSLRLQQIIGNRGEFTLAHTNIADDGINNGNGGSGGANSVICDDGTTAAGGAPVAGKSVVCKTVNNDTKGTVTNTIKKSNTTTKTTLAMYRQELDVAKATAYIGTEVIDISADSTTYNNSFNALQAQAGMWVAGTLNSAGSVSNTTETTPFAHVEFSPLEKLRLHVGERFGKINYAVDDRTSSNKDVAMTRSGNVLRTGATYDLDNNHLVWANWGETFNPQSTGSLLNSSSTAAAGNVIGQSLDPERGVTKQIGFRGLFQEVGLHYDVTVFDATTKGFITTRNCTAVEQTDLNGGLVCTINEAAGGLETNGVESMLTWSANRWLDLGATYTNARAFFTDYKTTSYDYTGKSYQAMPREKLNLRISVKPAQGWLVELEDDHISGYYVDNTNSYGTYSRPDILNLRASYRNKDWSFWVHALNLTDEKYATRVQMSTIGGVRDVLSAQAGQGNSGSYTPLTLRTGVSYKW